MGRKATARVPAQPLIFPRLYYERAWQTAVVIVEAGADADEGWGPLRSPFPFTSVIIHRAWQSPEKNY